MSSANRRAPREFRIEGSLPLVQGMMGGGHFELTHPGAYAWREGDFVQVWAVPPEDECKSRLVSVVTRVLSLQSVTTLGRTRSVVIATVKAVS